MVCDALAPAIGKIAEALRGSCNASGDQPMHR